MLVVVATLDSRAFAETALAADLDFASPINAESVSSGWGAGVRLGSHAHIPLLVMTPEIGFTYHQFGGSVGPNVYRGILGLRLDLGEVIRPGVFGHLGYGALRGTGTNDTKSSFTYDMGASLDFTLLPLLNIGAHAAYNRWTGGDEPAFAFGTLGAHAALIF